MSVFLQRPEADHVAANALAIAIRDGFPVSQGHTLVIPRHAPDPAVQRRCGGSARRGAAPDAGQGELPGGPAWFSQRSVLYCGGDGRPDFGTVA